MTRLRCLTILAALLALLDTSPASAQSDPTTPAPHRFERLRERLAESLDDGTDSDQAARSAPAGARIVADVAYGPDPAQRFDVFVPTRPAAGAAPVVFFVHGGGWARGDKANARVLEPKVAHWVGQGYVVISANYRMLPTPVAQQAEDVAAAIASAQSRAASWGGDPARFILMGHSAGAHLVALVAAGAPTAAKPQPWRGAVLLDSAALDVPVIMEHRHLGLYDRAFGTDPARWTAVSPIAQLARATAPMLAVCSSRRRESCGQADRFAAKANGLGGQVRVLREDLSHMQINATLGAASDYTTQVDAFMQSLR
ncbi:alpha/beta hydrolase [Scleromatobacter humisilvae]|uniref:Alpha/beta hydrolase n=1 Tax=Scleromatobacter humisilvae TaxID=2897159 RepID=A0A9X1YL79_9BURK|nr:alpha/beta hydrolase [Scleromatobacter humisilvae]MCK9688001.1 alpha/beta hydrolase [Scleromatobacter humisilvae]